jgi:hypothetical protein
MGRESYEKRRVLLLLGGEARHGKDTSALRLAGKYRFACCAISWHLKTLAACFGWDGNKRPESGRRMLQELGDWLRSKDEEVLLRALAEDMTRGCPRIFPATKISSKTEMATRMSRFFQIPVQEEELIRVVGEMPGLRIPDEFPDGGTLLGRWGRHIYGGFDPFEEFGKGTGKFCITDCRLPKEVSYFKRWGESLGYFVCFAKVVRPEFENGLSGMCAAHCTESGIRDMPADILLENDGSSAERLLARTEILAQSLLNETSPAHGEEKAWFETVQERLDDVAPHFFEKAKVTVGGMER